MLAIIFLILIIIRIVYLIMIKKIEKNKLLFGILLLFDLRIIILSKFKYNFIISRFIIIYLFIEISRLFILRNENIKIFFEKKRNAKIYLFLLLIFSLGIIFVPFENLFMKFKTPEEIFKYSFYDKKISKIFEGKIDTFIIDDDNFAWKFEKNKVGLFEFSSLNNSLNHFSLAYDIIELKNESNANVRFYVYTTKNGSRLINIWSIYDTDNIEIEDLLNSEVYKNGNKRYIFVEHDIKNYYIKINGEQIELD